MNITYLYQATGISIHICKEDGTLIESSQKDVFPSFYSYLLKTAPKNTPSLLAFPTNLWVCVAFLPREKMLILGPVSTREITKNDFCHDLDTFSFRNELDNLYACVQNIHPVSTRQLIAAAMITAKLLFGVELQEKDFVIVEKPISELRHRNALEKNRTQEVDEIEYHLPEEFMHSIFRMVREGNYEGFLNLFKTEKSGIGGRLSEDDERDLRYHFVYSTALAHYAAVCGGMDYEDACRIAEYFCMKMDSKSDTRQIDQLNSEMYSVFCRRVREKSRKEPLTPLISKCTSYVRMHVYEKLLVSDIASELGISAKWLSKKFLEEMGISITDYIHQVKIAEAELLLEYTTYNIAQVANLLSYGSESYFIKKFCQFTGKTPYAFRLNPDTAKTDGSVSIT